MKSMNEGKGRRGTDILLRTSEKEKEHLKAGGE